MQLRLNAFDREYVCNRGLRNDFVVVVVVVLVVLDHQGQLYKFGRFWT